MIMQRSPEWYRERAGKVTASRLKDVMATTKTGYSASRTNYMMELLCQRLSGNIEEGFTSPAMQRGIDLEPIARGAYEADKGVMVEEIGFINHPSINGFGASPDGLVGEYGLVEIKCPNTATHVEFLKTGKPKREYILQMHGQMLCTGRAWCDFVSYDDRLPGLEYRCVRVELDNVTADYLVSEICSFLNDLDAEIKAIEKLKEAA